MEVIVSRPKNKNKIKSTQLYIKETASSGDTSLTALLSKFSATVDV